MVRGFLLFKVKFINDYLKRYNVDVFFDTSLINPILDIKLDGKHNYKTFNCIFYTLKKIRN